MHVALEAEGKNTIYSFLSGFSGFVAQNLLT